MIVCPSAAVYAISRVAAAQPPEPVPRLVGVTDLTGRSPVDAVNSPISGSCSSRTVRPAARWGPKPPWTGCSASSPKPRTSTSSATAAASSTVGAAPWPWPTAASTWTPWSNTSSTPADSRCRAPAIQPLRGRPGSGRVRGLAADPPGWGGVRGGRTVAGGRHGDRSADGADMSARSRSRARRAAPGGRPAPGPYLVAPAHLGGARPVYRLPARLAALTERYISRATTGRRSFASPVHWAAFTAWGV